MAFEFAVPDKIFMGEDALALAKDTPLLGLELTLLLFQVKLLLKPVL